MANWRDEYYAALLVRDQREQANNSFYYACKKKTRTSKIKTPW
jgi:hypothetical protein